MAPVEDQEKVQQTITDELRAVIEEGKSKMEQHAPPVQTRGTYESGSDKFRITLIMFQSIENWLNMRRKFQRAIHASAVLRTVQTSWRES